MGALVGIALPEPATSAVGAALASSVPWHRPPVQRRKSRIQRQGSYTAELRAAEVVAGEVGSCADLRDRKSTRLNSSHT